jgi:hypothetical protein
LERVLLSGPCEMRYSKCVFLVNEMQDTPLVHTSPILGKGKCASPLSLSLSPHLANFYPHALSLYCCPGNHRTAITYCPQSRPWSTSPPCPQSWSTPLPRRRPRNTPPPSSSSSHLCAVVGRCHAAAVDLDHASLRARRCHPLPQALDTVSTKP